MSTETLNPHQSCSKNPASHRPPTNGFASKSVESLYSNGGSGGSGRSSSKPPTISLNMYKRKPARTMMPNGSGAPVSEVRQRVLSARMHRIRNIQNQLGDAQMHIGVGHSLVDVNGAFTFHRRQYEYQMFLHCVSEIYRNCSTRIDFCVRCTNVRISPCPNTRAPMRSYRSCCIRTPKRYACGRHAFGIYKRRTKIYC